MSNRHLFSNIASSKLAVVLPAMATSFLLEDGHIFPDVAGGDYMTLTLDDGDNIEIIRVTSKSGNMISECIRGQEGTIPREFPEGTLVENRVTAGTMAEMARVNDRLMDVSDMASLFRAGSSETNSVIIHEGTSFFSPTTGFRFTSAGQDVWRFAEYPEQVLKTSVTESGSTTSLTCNPGSFNHLDIVNHPAGTFIITFESGLNRGFARFLQSASGSGTIGWSGALPAITDIGDSFIIHKRTDYTLAELQDPANTFSLTFDPTDLFEDSLE